MTHMHNVLDNVSSRVACSQTYFESGAACTINYTMSFILGQYGKVFKGIYRRSEGPGYPVAIKTVKKYESEKEKESFLREMNIMSKLMHPNIVRLFGLVQQGKIINIKL